MLKSGTLQFVVDARHIRQLGEELVVDHITALSELIKNSHDADATVVEVNFQNGEEQGSTLEIIDDGSGMTLSDMEERWMRVSTDTKERHPTSPKYHRHRQGRKGIGRFAAETLGARLILSSTRNAETTEVIFNWSEQYRAGRDLSDIENAYRIVPAGRREHGTTLRIEGLHTTWTKSELERVARAVLLLQPPFRVKRRKKGQDPGFQIILRSGGEEIPKEVSPLRDFIAAATARVEGRVNESGKGTWRLRSSLLDLDDSQSFPERLGLGPFSFTVHYFIYRRDAIGDVGVGLATEMGNRYGGVRLYRDDLRILPYGDRGDDWLGLDDLYRQRTVLPPIANANWFGQVFFSRNNNPDLLDTSSREGLVSNTAFTEMRHFVKEGLIWGALRVAASRERKQRAGSPKRPAVDIKGRADFVGDTIDRAEVLLRESGALDRPSREVLTSLGSGVREARAQDKEEQALREQLIRELDLLRVLASVGTSMAVFSHEVRAVLNKATGLIRDLRHEIEQNSALQETAVAVEEGLDELADLARFIDAYISQSRRRTKKAQPLTAVTREFVEAFRSLVVRRGITLETTVHPRHLRTSPMTRSELDSILINLLTNAVKALDHERLERKAIRVDARASGGWAVLRFQDSGAGVDPSIEDRIFDPFVTTVTGTDPALGFGTGLGLKIVRDIVEANGGRVALAEADDGYTTCVEIRLRKAQ